MVLNGGGFKTAMFLGMLKGAKDSNLNPDIVIGTCGGSIATAIAHAIDNYEAQVEFVRSEQFYNMLKSIELTDYASVGKTLGLAKDFYTEYKLFGTIPNIFDNYLMDVPSDINLPEIATNFTPISHRSVIIAAEVLYNINDSGTKRGERQLFQQTIFTDDETAQALKGLTSHASTVSTSVKKEIAIVTNTDVMTAARASISDPFYMEPADINGKRYITGAIDLYPIEIAEQLGNEIIFVYPDKFDIVEQGAIYSTFNFSHNQRHEYVFSKEIDYLIDYTDFPSELKFTPKPDFLAWKIKSRLPTDYMEYREIVRRQFNYGYRKMLEAAKHKGTKKHIRNL